VTWHRVIHSSTSEVKCLESSGNTGAPGRVTNYLNINGKEACVEKVIDHAAGSTYYGYSYKVATDSGVANIKWALRITNCGPLYVTMEEVEACEKRRAVAEESYDPKLIVEKVLELYKAVE